MLFNWKFSRFCHSHAVPFGTPLVGTDLGEPDDKSGYAHVSRLVSVLLLGLVGVGKFTLKSFATGPLVTWMSPACLFCLLEACITSN